MGRGYRNVRATGGAVKPLARSIFDRLLPAGRKKDWRGAWGVVEAPSYEEGVGVDGRAEGLPSEKEGVLGQAKRAELERGLLVTLQGLPAL